MNDASPSTRIVITDIHPSPTGVLIFDMEVEELVGHLDLDKRCAQCGVAFTATVAKQAYCGGTCRVRAHRAAAKAAAEELIDAANETAP